MIKKVVLLAIVAVFVVGYHIAATMATEGKDLGAEEIVLPGGVTGKVPFPHRIHQENLQDCNQCHDLFPQKPGIIEELKNQGVLKKKQVMNHKCLKCHRDKKREGESGGPVSCTGCHSL